MEKNITTWRLSRSVLSQNSAIWDFRASWCRFASKSRDSLSVRLHQHAVWELHCILTGAASIVYEDGSGVTLSDGDFILLPPRTLHRFVYEQKDTMKLVVGFTVQAHADSVAEAFRAVDGKRVCRQSLPMGNLMDTLRMKAEQYYSVSSGVTLFLLQCIVLESLEAMYTPRTAVPELETKHSLDDARLDKATQYISQHLTDELTGEAVAGHLGISLRQLNRLSNDAFSCSIGHVILDMRMKYAQNLLEVSPLSLADIAELLHYSSVYAFIRAFKTATGTTPGKWQRDASLR